MTEQRNNGYDSNLPGAEKTWVIVSALDEKATQDDLESIGPKISDLVDKIHSDGKFVWTGPFDDGQGSMAVFNATQEEANKFYHEYAKICSGILNYYMYNWEVFPLLALLNPKQKSQ